MVTFWPRDNRAVPFQDSVVSIVNKAASKGSSEKLCAPSQSIAAPVHILDGLHGACPYFDLACSAREATPRCGRRLRAPSASVRLTCQGSATVAVQSNTSSCSIASATGSVRRSSKNTTSFPDSRIAPSSLQRTKRWILDVFQAVNSIVGDRITALQPLNTFRPDLLRQVWGGSSAAKSHAPNRCLAIRLQIRYASLEACGHAMLRIETERDGPRSILRLIGRVRSDCIEEIRKHVQNRATGTVLDLAEVNLIDLQSVRFLRDCQDKRIELRNCAPYILEWIRRERIEG